MIPPWPTSPAVAPTRWCATIAAGYFLVNERTFQRFGRGELQKIHFELDRLMREIRGEQPPLEDYQAVQARQRRMQRPRAAAVVLRAYRTRRKML